MKIIASLVMLALASPALATPPKNRPPDNRPPNGQETSQTQSQKAKAKSISSAKSVSTSSSAATGTAYAEGGQGGAGGEGGAGGAADAVATNEGIEVGGDSYHSESNNTNVVLVPNNNTSNCMRVWGISFGTHEGAAGLGLPTRDASCDFEQAADDAAATGSHKIAWWWRCQKKNLYKTFQVNRSAAEAKLACWNSMVEMIAPETTGQVLIPEEEYENLLLAQVQQEEVERVQDKLIQQQTLIESLKEELDDHEADAEELERLKREAARLRAAQEAEEKEEAETRAKFKRRLEERAQEKGDE